MESILQGLPPVCVCVPGRRTHLWQVTTGAHEEPRGGPQQTGEAGLRLQKEKCAFLLPEVEYLGHKICRDGLQPTETKVRAVAEAPEPQ